MPPQFLFYHSSSIWREFPEFGLAQKRVIAGHHYYTLARIYLHKLWLSLVLSLPVPHSYHPLLLAHIILLYIILCAHFSLALLYIFIYMLSLCSPVFIQYFAYAALPSVPSIVVLFSHVLRTRACRILFLFAIFFVISKSCMLIVISPAPDLFWLL